MAPAINSRPQSTAPCGEALQVLVVRRNTRGSHVQASESLVSGMRQVPRETEGVDGGHELHHDRPVRLS